MSPNRYSYHRRNQQPTFRGNTHRIGANDPEYADSEISYARQGIQAACARTGALYAHFRRMTPGWNDGPCRRCSNTIYSGGVDPDCQICYGTGFNGGYSRPIVQWVLLQQNDEELRRTEYGFLRLRQSESISPFLPVVQNSDIFAKLALEDGEWRTERRYVVTSMVRPVRVRETTEVITRNTWDHLDPEPEIVGYRFDVAFVNYYAYDSEGASPIERVNAENPIEYKIPFEDPIWLADLKEHRR